MADIIFTIQGGEVKEEVQGATPGTHECLQLTQPYEQALSSKKPEDREYKPEFRPTTATLKQSQRNQNTL